MIGNLITILTLQTGATPPPPPPVQWELITNNWEAETRPWEAIL